MRPLEIAVFVALIPLVIATFVSRARHPRWINWLPYVVGILIVLHLLIEGYRWQMVPAYALGLVFLTWKFWVRRPQATSRRWLRLIGRTALGLAALLVFSAAVSLCIMIPVFKMPELTGKYRVGTTKLELVDHSRQEIFGGQPGAPRDLVVEAWYPAQPAPGARRAPLWRNPHIFGAEFARSSGIPTFLYDHLQRVQSHSYPDAPLVNAEKSFPVLIFSHGYSAFPPSNQAQFEELASHGYVIFSIGHPYESAALLYPDGRVVRANRQRLKSGIAEVIPVMTDIWPKLQKTNDPSVVAELMRKFNAASPTLIQSLTVWVADTSFVLDELAKLNAAANGLFTGRLDFSRVGLFGMSFGGTTAGQFCLHDPRCKAGLDMDGIQMDAEDQPIPRPFMFMRSGGGSEKLNDPAYDVALGPAYKLVVPTARHVDYTDVTLVSPLFRKIRKIGALGPIDGQRMVKIYNSYSLAFFDKYLKGIDSPLLSGPSPFPEVVLQSRAKSVTDVR